MKKIAITFWILTILGCNKKISDSEKFIYDVPDIPVCFEFSTPIHLGSKKDDVINELTSAYNLGLDSTYLEPTTRFWGHYTGRKNINSVPSLVIVFNKNDELIDLKYSYSCPCINNTDECVATKDECLKMLERIHPCLNRFKNRNEVIGKDYYESVSYSTWEMESGPLLNFKYHIRIR